MLQETTALTQDDRLCPQFDWKALLTLFFLLLLLPNPSISSPYTQRPTFSKPPLDKVCDLSGRNQEVCLEGAGRGGCREGVGGYELELLGRDFPYPDIRLAKPFFFSTNFSPSFQVCDQFEFDVQVCTRVLKESDVRETLAEEE